MLVRQPVLRRLLVVLQLVAQALVRRVLQALALVRLVLQALALAPVPVHQEYLLSTLRAQNRAGRVVQVWRAPDERLVAQGARPLQRQSDERVLGERHRRDGYRLRALRCHRRVRRRCRRWQPEEAVQSGGPDQGSQVQDRRPQQRHRVQDERCDRPMTKVKRRHRRG